MNYQQVKGILKKITFFQDLNDETLTYIAHFGKGVSIKAGCVLFHEGSLGDQMYMIISGSVEVYKVIDGGYHTVLAKLGVSDVIGEMALFDEFPRSATVRALEDCVLISLTRKEFQVFLESHCSIAIKLLINMSQRLRDANEKLTERKIRGYFPDI